MLRHTLKAGGLLVALLVGCTKYYVDTGLNRLTPGITTQQFAAYFPQQGRVAGPIVRASKIAGQDTLTVVTMPMQPQGYASDQIDYWFIFKNSRLVQWGRPEDWKTVAATYQIDFSPAPSVKPPN